MIRALTIAAALLLGISAANARLLRKDVIACSFIGDAHNHQQILGARDQVAYYRFRQEKLPTQSCVEFAKGQEFDIERLSKWTGQQNFGCARFPGQVACLWVSHYDLMTADEWRKEMGL